MATMNTPKNAKPMVKFNFISSNYVSSVNTHANTPTPLNKLMEVLHDGITSKQGTYGAVLLVGGTTAYIEFKVEEDCRFWATSGLYSDSGGASGKELNIFKYNNELQTYQLFKTVPTTATEDWYVVCDLLTKGTYKIQAKGNYVQFNEFYFESIVENKTLVLHDGQFKKFTPLNKSNFVSIIPEMTTNTAPIGVAEASSIYGSSYDAWKAFDKKDTTIWHSGSGTPQWISYEGLSKKRVTRLLIVGRYDSLISSQGLKTFTIQGYNTNTNSYVDIATITDNTTWQETEKRIYDFENKNEYLKYRLYITATTGTSAFAVTQVDFLEPLDIVEAHWSTVSNTLPTPTQFLEQGMDNLSPLDRKVIDLEPLPMINKSEILGVGELGKMFSKTVDLRKYFDIRSIGIEVK